ncbi:MAG: hypothetical protein ACK4UV_10275, partial [Ignavibacterium sp.]
FIRLKQGRPDLFNAVNPKYDYSYHIKFVPVEGGQTHLTDAAYNVSARTVSFQIPAALQTSTIYAAQLIRKQTPKRTPGQLVGGPLINPSINNYNKRLSDIIRIDTIEVSSGVRVRQNRIDGRLTSNPDEKLYYVFFFKTSKYRNLQNKINRLNNVSTERVSRTVLFLLTEELKPSFDTDEKFDVFDVNGYTYQQGINTYKVQPLVRTLDGLDNNWYNTFAYPVMYEYYNELKNYTTRRLRDVQPYGIPPVNTVEINYPVNALSETEYLPQSQSPSNQFSNMLNLISSGFGSGLSGGFGIGGGGFYLPPFAGPEVRLTMTTATIAWVDYQVLRQMTANHIRRFGHPSYSEFYTEPLRSQMLRFLSSTWRPLFRGAYRAGFYYFPIHCIDPDQFNLPTHYKNYTY